jgi:hypothetical protein
LKQAFEGLGAQVDSPSGDGYLLRVQLENRTIIFSLEALPLNNVAADRLAHDKLATYQILSNLGVQIPRGVAFFAQQNSTEDTCQSVETARLATAQLSSVLLEEFPELASEEKHIADSAESERDSGMKPNGIPG